MSGEHPADEPIESVEVTEVDAATVRPLRRAVLRAGMAIQDVDWPEDSIDGVVHLALCRAGEIAAVSTWIPKPPPPGLDLPAPSVQLRGMATRPADQGRGWGSVLLAEGIERCRARGAASVWANARDAALSLYRRHGFTVHEPGFVDPTTGLPHHVITLTLTLTV